MSERNELKPCPFCGLDGEFVTPDSSPTPHIFQADRIFCVRCGATGPDGESTFLAEEAWNRRA